MGNRILYSILHSLYCCCTFIRQNQLGRRGGQISELASFNAKLERYRVTGLQINIGDCRHGHTTTACPGMREFQGVDLTLENQALMPVPSVDAGEALF